MGPPAAPRTQQARCPAPRPPPLCLLQLRDDPHVHGKRTEPYRYYVCNNAQQHGRATCPAPSVPAGEIERFVVEEIKAIGRDPAPVAATLAESRRLAHRRFKA